MRIKHVPSPALFLVVAIFSVLGWEMLLTYSNTTQLVLLMLLAFGWGVWVGLYVAADPGA